MCVYDLYEEVRSNGTENIPSVLPTRIYNSVSTILSNVHYRLRRVTNRYFTIVFIQKLGGARFDRERRE